MVELKDEKIYEIGNGLKLISRKDFIHLSYFVREPNGNEQEVVIGRIIGNRLDSITVYEIHNQNARELIRQIDLGIDKDLKERNIIEIRAKTHNRFANFLINNRGFELVERKGLGSTIRRTVGTAPTENPPRKPIAKRRGR